MSGGTGDGGASSRCLEALASCLQGLGGLGLARATALREQSLPEKVQDAKAGAAVAHTADPVVDAPAFAAPARRRKVAKQVREPVRQVDPSPEGLSVPFVPREDPASRPFWCGRWPGARNDYEGEAGFRFLVNLDCEVTALGRPCEPPLMEAAAVSLWHAASQDLLASISVGPASRVEGSYAWERLPEAIVLRPGQEYRLTLRCRANMQDRWSDATCAAEEAAAESWAALASFLGGACKNANGFPSRTDGDLRRPGIVNFKALLRPSNEPALRDVGREAFARSLAASAAAEARAGDEVESRLAALAGLVALFVDEIRLPAMALLGAEEELQLIAASAAACSPSGALELAGCGIFDSRALLF
ncbi:unnamed protein product [Symbiodinium sp. CCMP2456]|nr:unnamed protein product [Symbiodinium sp. CCMP2456]